MAQWIEKVASNAWMYGENEIDGSTYLWAGDAHNSCSFDDKAQHWDVLAVKAGEQPDENGTVGMYIISFAERPDWDGEEDEMACDWFEPTGVCENCRVDPETGEIR